MSKYILEIKNRLILLFITWFSVILTGYFYKETLLFLFLESEVFYNSEFKVYYFIFTDIAEVFYVYINLVMFISLQILFLYLIYHGFIFFSFSLFIVEYNYLRFTIKTFVTVWFISIFLSKYVLIPAMWEFFFNFQSASSLNLHFEAKLSEYFDFYIQFYYIFIFYCQIFTVLFLFVNYSNANSLYIKKFRKLYYYFFILFSTLVSPPDIGNQLLIGFIIVFCYEMFVFGLVFKLTVKDLVWKPVEAN